MIRHSLIFLASACVAIAVIVQSHLQLGRGYLSPKSHDESIVGVGERAEPRAERSASEGRAPTQSGAQTAAKQIQPVAQKPANRLQSAVSKSISKQAHAKVKKRRNASATEPELGHYIVTSGDTLPLIAIKLYGSALQTEKVLRHNPELRADPKSLRIGQRLTVVSE